MVMLRFTLDTYFFSYVVFKSFEFYLSYNYENEPFNLGI